MKRFAELYEAIDSTTSTNRKVEAMVAYFREADPRDAAWALYFLTGQKLKRLVPARSLARWTLELTGLPEWLFGESYDAVGDLAETISLLAEGAELTPRPPGTPAPVQGGLFESPPAEEAGPGSNTGAVPLHVWVEQRLERLRGLSPEQQRGPVLSWWAGLDRAQLFLVVKLLTGSLRVGVSRTLVVRALAEVAAVPAAVMEHRLMGNWRATPEFLRGVLAADVHGDESAPATDLSRPYPFFLASQLEGGPETLGEPRDWQIEWKWDGIRAQLIRRGGSVFLWSRGEELISDRFPEIADAAARLPDGVALDGEVLAFRDDRALPFARLQRRIGRTNITGRALREAPVVFMAYDVLEQGGEDVRARPLSERRAILESLLAAASPRVRISPTIEVPDWPAAARLRAESRARAVEGLMLKKLDSLYGVGRRRGDWWKWKIDPYCIDAVLVYAQPGHGRRAGLLTDYTFAVWDGPALSPIAKAYSGLDQGEIEELDRWIRQHTVERFGPVRSVEPIHVFELHFEAISASPRHRSGIAVRFPRIARWRKDKPAAEADTMDSIRRLLSAAPPPDSPDPPGEDDPG
ncbi:MAG: ATP-dependent DNA ligase [Phycisphaerales bacterium]|nr:ATP-dependent DNA ligase [Phycisphaerales bacterium]